MKNISALDMKLTSVSAEVLELQRSLHLMSQKYEKCKAQQESQSDELKTASLEREAFEQRVRLLEGDLKTKDR